MSEDCPHCVFEKTEANCRGCFEGSHYRPKPITNADRIRSMTDDELANELSGQCPAIFGGYRMSGEDCAGFESCQECWLDWLKQEVKG